MLLQQLSQFIINHWALCLAFLIILLLVLLNEGVTLKSSAKAISPTQAIDAINNTDAIIIDIRPVEQFSAGHIIHAKPAREEDFTQSRMDAYKTKPIILVCARGIQSTALASKLRKQGFNPMSLAGGMTAWQTAGLPVVKGNR